LIHLSWHILSNVVDVKLDVNYYERQRFISYRNENKMVKA